MLHYVFLGWPTSFTYCMPHANASLEHVDALPWCHLHRSSNAACRSTMSVRIQFDRPQVHFTNLDFLTGKVIIHLVADAAISAVTVKLEGESRTRLSGPKLAYNNERSDKRRTELEWHKVSKCCLCYFEECHDANESPSCSTKSKPFSPPPNHNLRLALPVTCC